MGWPVCILKKLEGTEFVPRFKFTFKVRACFVFSGQTEESVAWTLKVNEPVAVVVPEIVPFALRLSPAGSAPQEIFHLYGGVPPVASNTLAERGPVTPCGKARVPTGRRATRGAATMSASD